MKGGKAVFSDIDGTLLNSEHRVTELTGSAVKKLKQKEIPFVLVSARSPAEIYPILEENGFVCPVISCSGALILNERREVLYQRGMEKKDAVRIIQFIEEQNFDLAWCLYTLDEWIVREKDDPRILHEEEIVKLQAKQGSTEALPEEEKIYKLMCICNGEEILEIEEKLKEAFPECSVVKSSDILIEIMAGGVNKAKAVEWLCDSWKISPKEAVAFGDNYNDLEMLELCCGIVMGNAPEDIKKRIGCTTEDHDHDGIYHGLKQRGMV